MSDSNGPHSDRNDWGVVLAVSLIAVGVWFLIAAVAGPRWQAAMRMGAEIIWPLALVALGVVLFLSSRRGGQPSAHAGRRLYRSRHTRMIGGVLGGVAEYFDVDPTIVRVAYVILAYLSGVFAAVVAYVIATIVIPEAPVDHAAAYAAGSPGSSAGPVVTPSAAPTTGSEATISSDSAATHGPTPPPAPPVPPAQGTGWPHTGESGPGGSQ